MTHVHKPCQNDAIINQILMDLQSKSTEETNVHDFLTWKNKQFYLKPPVTDSVRNSCHKQGMSVTAQNILGKPILTEDQTHQLGTAQVEE